MDEITTLAIWLGFALICYGVALKKGRNEWIALGMGLLLGAISLIYYLVARGSKEYELEKAEDKLRKAKEL
jgi:hypothetical protein